MTRDQCKDLYAEWNLYTDEQQREIVKDYLATCGGRYSQDDWHEFLSEHINLRYYWHTIGQL